MDLIDRALRKADLFVAVGTSGAVYPAAGLVAEARAYGLRTCEINLEAADNADLFDETYGRQARRRRPGSRSSSGRDETRLGRGQRLRGQGDPGCVDPDLPQLSERRRNGAAEEKSGLDRWRAADERRSGIAQNALGVGQEGPEVGTETGCEDDGVDRSTGDCPKTTLSRVKLATSPRSLILLRVSP